MKIYLYQDLDRKQLETIYETARDERVLDLVSFDAPINKDKFLRAVKQLEVFGTGFDETGRPLGFFYLTSFEGATARLHFCFFKAGCPDRLAIGRAVLAWCFDSFKLEALIGVVPYFNRPALNYALEMGGREMGSIPGMCWIHRLKRAVGGVQFIFTDQRKE